ncbi:precorrin-2 C20-methyltransferase / precorrin-3B C17-methyltransferase [Nocardioides exalbidus]|uniref:Precorrin-2 C20-methyltransferase / precorrin-3B C17-methyltransferase n=1 Tax=Nocardioides exalbidus TaxID=402596 RepID=A0A1H4M6D0_9ACTN|nr:precorrin-2 C(20)-methyltransferase [Nocardioides exalbidus]SEB77962.1 precorrin-2 C20-methyltransferase / precorrin-3B C17-methyltransferase [Nocardioides exalbidus]
MTGRLYGVGLGPGDPELITLKAARLIESADVIAFHAGVGKTSNARTIAASLIPASAIEEELRYPVTTGETAHPGGYAGAMAEFYESCSARLGAHLEAGRTVVVLAEGDPLFYGSFMYLHDRLSPRFPTEVVPGVPAFAAATAVLASPLVRQTDVLTVLPGTLPVPELARRLADTDGAIIMKLGRTFPRVVEALRQAGRLEHALYVERASMPAERWMPVVDVDPTSVPYFSLIVVPGDSKSDDPTGRRATSASLVEEGAAQPLVEQRGTSVSKPRPLKVIGLGPGPDKWLTPEATEALADVDHVIGYAPYVNRVPQREGLTRHASGNTVEVDRARHALTLASQGERVAVVSGGDAGVFGMASAVFEAAPDFPDVPIEVLPGVSAFQAVAARAGAPVGADFAVLSLSDRLKPWPVIEKRLRAIAEADLVLAVYNPASRSRTTRVADLQKLFLEHRSADTVVVVGRDVGRAEESLTVTTLAELEADTIDMKCLLIIGASSTTVTAAGQVWTPRFVEGE